MISKKTFVCKLCGECCKKFLVKITAEEIKKLEQLGYKHFYHKDFDGKESLFVLEKDDNGCIFLKKQNNTYICSIYPNRPETCKKYPFLESDEVEDCKPGKNFVVNE